ncbi:MAG TPA: Gfo/Idh/MocA family oxidoreductase [Armatimonadota bacterium]
MSSLSRRRFLEDTALSAAALAAAGLGRADRASAAEAPSTRRIGPNDQVRIAQIGFHGQGMSHINAYLKMPDVALAALCDVDESQTGQAMAAVDKAGKKAPKFLQDLRRVFDDPNIDAVSIATPNHWHALAAIWAMQAGKDVYVEKPVSHNVLEGRRMVEASRRYNRICQAGTQCRSMKGTIDAIEYVQSGKIGKVTLARGLCYKRRDTIGKKADAPVPSGVDYDIWLGPAPKRPFNPNRFHYNWHWNWDYGNGDVGNQGIHQMDIARWGLRANGLPRSVVGLGGRFAYYDDGETPNTMVSVMDYGDRQLIFEVRGLPTQDLDTAMVGNIFYGSEGIVVLTSYTGGAAYDLDGNQVQRFDGGGDHHRNFIDAVKSRRREDLKADILEGHLSSALCHLGNISYRLGESRRFSAHRPLFGDNAQADETYARMMEHTRGRVFDAVSAARTPRGGAKSLPKEQEDLAKRLESDGRSYRLGRTLKVDAKRERFIDAPEADALLSREYRAPFVVPEKV